MSLTFSPAAIADIGAIWDYTAETWSVGQADHYVDDIRNACVALAGGGIKMGLSSVSLFEEPSLLPLLVSQNGSDDIHGCVAYCSCGVGPAFDFLYNTFWKRGVRFVLVVPTLGRGESIRLCDDDGE